MTKIGRCILLGADIDLIYDVLLDGYRMPEWFEHITDIEIKNDFPQAGGTAKITFQYGEALLYFSMTSLEMVRGEYGVFKLEGDLVGIQRWTTTPERGGYRLSIDYEYDMASVGMTRFVERITRETFTTSLQNLKSLVETRTIPAYF